MEFDSFLALNKSIVENNECKVNTTNIIYCILIFIITFILLFFIFKKK